MSSNAAMLTREQVAALAPDDRSVSLAAGAGCGKTFVLTQRFLSYVDPRVLKPTAQLHELVAITFTDAAASEMRQRIRSQCYARLAEADNPQEADAWQRVLRGLDGSRISTIHAFCTSLLRTHSVEAEVDPRFEVLDAPAADLLRMQTLDDRLRELLLAEDESLLRLATRFGLGSLRETVARLLGENHDAVFERWRDAQPEQVVAAWEAHFATVCQPEALQEFLEADAVCELRSIVGEVEQESEPLRRLLAEIADEFRLLTGKSLPPQPFNHLIQLARVQGPGKKSNWNDPSQFENFRDTCKVVRELGKKSLLNRCFDPQQAGDTAEAGLMLLRLVEDIAHVYFQVKRERNVLEFDDLLNLAHRLLTGDRYPAIRQQLSRGTRLLLVDEFQDTDPLQVDIVKALRGERWAEQGLFVVGDHKQSIYRFRGAEPSVSNELRASLPEPSRLSLTTNFRSQPAILHFVNALFCEAFHEEYEPLRANRPQLSPTPAVEFLWAGNVEPEADRYGRTQTNAQIARAQEARFIARRLAQLIDSQEPIIVDSPKGADGSAGARPLQLGDIAILFRSLSDVGIYETALREQGLDYYLAGGHAFYAQQEVFDILNLLRALESRADEVSLAGALRSPLFSLVDETLFWMVQQHGSLCAGILANLPPSQLDMQQREALRRAAQTISHLRRMKDRCRVAELLTEALARTGYDATLLCDFLGERKVANLQKLVEQARAIDRNSPGDLAGFITQLAEFTTRLPKEPLAATQTEGDAIRLMTIHVAKGLEFPLVVVPNLERKSNLVSFQPVFDRQLGPLVHVPDNDNLVGMNLYRHAEQQQEMQERKRLLYVACTRAADYLLLSATLPDPEKPSSDWLKFLDERFCLADGSLRMDLPEGYEIPQILVTTSEPEAPRNTSANPSGTNLAKLLEETLRLSAEATGALPPEVAPVPVDHSARRRFSFSRLTGQFVSGHQSTSRSEAPERSSLDARGLGTLVHAVLERANFGDPTAAAKLCEHLAPLHVTHDVEATAAEAQQMIAHFLQSPRARAIASAAEVRHEVEFILPWHGQDDPAAGRYLHGFIDCLYRDTAGDWHLVDYKTNRVESQGVDQAAERYAMQMFVYGLACEQALGAKPVESVLHFLRPETEFQFQFSEAESQAMANQIDQAIRLQLNPVFAHQ